MLTLTDGSLILEDAKTVMGSIGLLERFGPSAFGPIQVRVVAANGIAGDWMPLGTLVRLPGFKELRCSRATAKPCTLSGTSLFLAIAFSASQDFAGATDVPPEFTGTQITVPHPANGVLYLKLRDDPASVHVLTLPITVAAGESRNTSAITPLTASTANHPVSTATTASESPAPEAREQPSPISTTDSVPEEAAKPATSAQSEAQSSPK
jgi:hypothetical protein